MKTKWRSGRTNEVKMGKKFLIIDNAINPDRPHQISFTLEELLEGLEMMGPFGLEGYLLYLKRVVNPIKGQILNANPG